MEDGEQIELSELLTKLGLNKEDSEQVILLTAELLHKKVFPEE